MPHKMPADHTGSYIKLATKIFLEKPLIVSNGDIDHDEIQKDLTKVFSDEAVMPGE